MQKIKNVKKDPFDLLGNTTHCSGQLQRMLLGEGLAEVRNDEVYSSKVTFNLMEEDLRRFENLTKAPDLEGYGEGVALPGFSFHQALLSGVAPLYYLLHYEIVADEDCTLAYLSKKNGCSSIM
jgi:hypothetical protein